MISNNKIDNGYLNANFIDDDGKRESGDQYELQTKQIKGEPSYDPYKERKVERPTTNFDTFIHLMKGAVGTGILAMPNAFQLSGYIIGPIFTIIIGMFCTYCVHILIKVEYVLCKRHKVPVMNYPAVAAAAVAEGPTWIRSMSPYALHIVNAFLLLFQLGICSIYVVFVAFNVKAISDNYTEQETDIRLVMLPFFVPLVLLSWVRNLKYLVPFSGIGNVLTFSSFGIICYYIFRYPLNLEGKDPTGDPVQYPIFFGTVMFALEAIGVIFPLENEMKTPKSFGTPCGVLNISMIGIVFLYVGMGFFGYLAFGTEIQGSITLNLPSNDILAQSAKAMLAFSFILSHGLACFVSIGIMWSAYFIKYFPEKSGNWLWEYVIRTSSVVIPFIFAVAIPNIPLFISLIGALTLSFLGLIFPSIIQTCTYWNYVSGFSKSWMIVKNLFILFIGLFGLVIGTYTSIKEIIAELF